LVRNPFRTEAEAFRFVWLTIIYFALIVIGAVINTWLGLGVFIGETAIVIWWVLTHGRREDPIPQAPPAHDDGEHRILVIANETVGGEELLAELRRRVGGVKAQVFVVSPALNSKLRHWVSDEDQARLAAQSRLDDSLDAMRAAGIEARGQIGDSDPLQAIEDGIRIFAPDELVISTHPEGRSNWLERGIVDHTRERFAVPVAHVVVDLGPAAQQAAGAAETA
jgi:GABA permease